MEVAVPDIDKHINHILKVLKSRKKLLVLEIYDDVLLLIYNYIEMPVKILKPSRKTHNLKAQYELPDKALFINLIKKCKDMPTVKLTFTDNSLETAISETLYSLYAKKI